MATIDRSVPVFTQGDDLDWPQKRAYCESIVAALGFTDYEYRESAISAVAQIRDGAARIAGTFSHVVRDYVRDRHLDTVVLGLRSAESRGRRLSRAVRGRDYVTANNLRHLLPIADWSGRDVLAWLITRDLPLFPLYTWPDPTPPHDRRMSWPIIPNQMQHGEARFVRRHAPDLWYRLVAVAPHLSADV
jgi:hypothetical protein